MSDKTKQKEIYEREIAPKTPFICSQKFVKNEDNYNYFEPNITISEEFLYGIKTNSTIQIIIPFLRNKLEYNGEIYKNWCEYGGGNCNCLFKSENEKFNTEGHFTYKIKNEKEIISNNKHFLFDDWLKQPINKKFDEMFGCYIPFKDTEGNSYSNVFSLNEEAWKLFLIYNSIPKTNIIKMINYIQKDIDEFETTITKLEDINIATSSLKIKEIINEAKAKIEKEKTES